MLLIQLVSMNVFYSIWRLEVIVFYIKVYCETEVFSIAMLLLSLEQVIWEKSVFYIISTIIVPRVDAGGWQCCQCSTPKWLTLISMVEFSFLKMLWTRLSNLTTSSSGWHCSVTLNRLEDTIFLVILFLTQFAIPYNVLSVLASFSATKLQIS